jgi:hypothetical protein
MGHRVAVIGYDPEPVARIRVFVMMERELEADTQDSCGSGLGDGFVGGDRSWSSAPPHVLPGYRLFHA